MKQKTKYLLPSSYELIAMLVVALLLLLVVNSHQLLDYYGYTQSGYVLQNGAGTAVTSGLSRLDTFRLTDQVVTFLIWAGVGAICFSLVQAMMNFYQTLQRDRELSSSRYVHPAAFSRQKFWRQISREFSVLVSSLLIGLCLLYGLLAVALPTAIAYSRTLFGGYSLANVGYFVIGLAVVYLWLLLLWLCGRAVFYHRQLAD